MTKEEVLIAAKKLRRGKASGPDGIPAEVVQIAANMHADALLQVLNKCLRQGLFPDTWKTGNLVLIPKEGCTPQNEKYRPICLLDALAKLYEHIVNERLRVEIDRVGGISCCQHAYQHAKSTITATDSVMQFMDKTKKRGPGWIPAIILLDVTNAFNSAPWKAIVNRLAKLNIHPYLRKTIQSYLSNRTLVLEKTPHSLSSGVP